MIFNNCNESAHLNMLKLIVSGIAYCVVRSSWFTYAYLLLRCKLCAVADVMPYI